MSTPTTTNKTGLYLRGTPLDPAFKGTPQEFFEAMLSHMDVVAPYGISTFVVGGQMPSGNQGPWLKDGKEWWIFNEDATPPTYEPLMIASSLPTLFYLQEATPPLDAGVQVWFQTQTVGGVVYPKAINLNLDQTAWIPIGTPTSGPTASRPVGAADFALFYDTDIEAMLIWNGLKWVTQDGVIGDAKFVTWSTRFEALRHNPGWEVLWDGPIRGSTPSNRGLLVGQATSDFDGSNASPVSGFAVDRSALVVSGIGATAITLALANLPEHSHDINLGSNSSAIGEVLRAGSTSWFTDTDGAFLYLANSAVIGGTTAHPHAVTAANVAAHTLSTGQAVPIPISFAQDPPTLWMFALRKVE